MRKLTEEEKKDMNILKYLNEKITLKVTFYKIIPIILSELKRAKMQFHDFHSFYEGYALILEELDELWEEIKKKKVDQSKLKKEAIQVAATTIRFIIDLLEDDI